MADDAIHVAGTTDPISANLTEPTPPSTEKVSLEEGIQAVDDFRGKYQADPVPSTVQEWEKESSEKRFRGLEELLREYQEFPEILSKRHLGAYIMDIHKETQDVSSRIPRIRHMVYSIMSFVLEHMADDKSKLDECDEDGWTPIQIAINCEIIECLELLLQAGANPQVRFEHLRAVRHPLRAQFFEIHSVLVLHNLLQCWRASDDPSGRVTQYSFTWFDSAAGWRNDCLDVKLGNMLPMKLLSEAEVGLRAWFHVPFTSIPILLSLARTIDGFLNENTFDDSRSPGRMSLNRYRATEILQRTCRAPAIIPSIPLLHYLDTEYHIFEPVQNDTKKASATVFPCLVLDTIGNVMRKKESYIALTTSAKHGSPLAGGDLGICLERTLDESYYPSLDRESLEVRNRDQVITKEYMRTSNCRFEESPILMVPQFWLWRFDQVLLTAFSMIRASAPLSDPQQAPCIDDSLKLGDASLDLQIGLILASQITSFGTLHNHHSYGSGIFKPPLDMFETALVSELSAVHLYLQTDRTTLKTREQKKKELEFIHLISDIHSELDMIQSVIDQQKEVMDQLLADTEEERNKDMDSRFKHVKGPWGTVTRARESLDQYTSRINKIHKDAERIEKTIDSFLNLQRTYANIEDTQNNMLVGLAALAFAIVTVIFTPLSFMTSLFALPVREILEHQKLIDTSINPSRAFDFQYVGGYIALAGFTTWIPTGLLIAFLYLRWTGYFVQPENQIDLEDDDTCEESDDEEESELSISSARVPLREGLREGLRRRWNDLKIRQKKEQTLEEETGTETGGEESGREDHPVRRPQVADAEAGSDRRNRASMV